MSIKKSNTIKRGTDTMILHTISYIFNGSIAILCLLPFIMIISASFSDEMAVQLNGFSLLPQKFTLEAYKQVFAEPMVIGRAYLITILLTLLGTAIGLLFQSMTAYVLSRRDFKWRNGFSLFFYITTLFNGGLVSYFILMTQYLHMKNNYLALFLPLAFSVYNLLVLKSYILGIPNDLIDASKIDGCSVFRTYLSVVLPVIKPALATVGLFIALAYWNDWYSAMLFITNDKMKPLQYMLYEKINNIEAYKRLIASGLSKSSDAVSALSLPTQTLKMALTVVVTGPIILLYPIVQKYYVQGITIGAVKG
ncbi:putative aldouronate transport system permease protein [Anaerotaenia torta]|uniref:carbohydrate ABC transporter permease n=1 Tax=Anaerotaenia torta TaxID=433293 RepID=UPI003D194EC7